MSNAFVSLLPPNATELERQLEQLGIINLENPIETLADADRIPEHLLNALAIGWSVDEWRNDWSESQKRAAVRNAFYIHQTKGTIAAVKATLAQYALTPEITQWYETIPAGQPKTFHVKLISTAEPITESMVNDILRKIILVKPATAHFAWSLKYQFDSSIQPVYSSIASKVKLRIKSGAELMPQLTSHFQNMNQHLQGLTWLN